MQNTDHTSTSASKETTKKATAKTNAKKKAQTSATKKASVSNSTVHTNTTNTTVRPVPVTPSSNSTIAFKNDTSPNKDNNTVHAPNGANATSAKPHQEKNETSAPANNTANHTHETVLVQTDSKTHKEKSAHSTTPGSYLSMGGKTVVMLFAALIFV